MQLGKIPNVVRYYPEKVFSAYARRHGFPLAIALRMLMKQNFFPERFKRNAGLISPANQIRLLDLPLFIAGCGGLGEEMAAHLVQFGAANIFLCDYDIYEESNLNRQRFCVFETLGQSKVLETTKALRQKAPWGNFHPVSMKLDSASIPDCLNESALIIDCLDSVTGKQMLENMARERNIPWLHGAVLAYEGFACLESQPTGIIENLYGATYRESGAGSVLSHVVAGTAAIMCSLFLRWLEQPLFSSKLLHADFSIPEMESFHISQAQDQLSEP